MIQSTVIIPVYNEIKNIPRLLNSISKQKIDPSCFEVLVVDGGSTDGTIEFASEYNQIKNLSLIHSKQPSNLSVNRNEGINNASGEILIFIDADMEVEPDWLANHVKFITEHKIDGAVGNVIHPNPDKNKFIDYLNHPGRGAKQYPSKKKIQFDHLMFWNTAIKKSIFLKSGLFDEKIHLYGGEDFEMAYRIFQIEGIEIRYNLSAVSYHHQKRTLHKTGQLLYHFGLHGMPYIIQKYPETKNCFAIKKIEKIPKIIRFFIINRIIKIIADSLYKILPNQFCFWVIRYILFYSIYSGYKKSKK